MGGRPQKREKASGRKEWELGSTWNLKWTHVGIGVRCLRWDVVLVLRVYVVYVGTLSSFCVGTGLRCPRWDVGTLGRWDVGTLGRWDGFTVGAGDGVTLRGC